MKKISFYTIIFSCAFGLSSCKAGHSALQAKVEPYAEIPFDFNHTWDKKLSHPFTGAAAIDIDGDKKMEIFIGGGQGHKDALFAYRDGKFVDIIEGTNLISPSLAATYGATSIDIDNDGDVDLLLARNDGAYIYLNHKGKFTAKKLVANFPEHSVPFSIAVSDIDHDGDGDLYISNFVDFPHFKSATFNNPTHAKANVMLLNEGNLKFTDITKTSGTAAKQNTFQSTFADLDNDGWEDLIVAQNTGEIEIFKNLKNKTFEYIKVDEGYGFWMGLALGDFDKDGDQDLLFTNVGKSIPYFLTKGDRHEDQRPVNDWVLLRNDGAFKFTNVSKKYNLGNQGFAWGAAFEDLNSDGALDLIVAQNYVKWPVHHYLKLDGRVLLQETNAKGENKFVHHKELGLENPYFGQAPLIVDINNDGREDIIWINMLVTSRAFLNKTESNNYITVAFADNVASLGTKVTVNTKLGKSYSRVLLNSSSTMIDQAPELSFGLGDVQKIDSILIEKLNGKKKVIKNPSINQKIFIQNF